MSKLSLSVEEVVSATGLGRTKIYALLRSGKLKARKVGARTIILKDDLDDFLKGLESYPHPKVGKQ